MSTITSLDNVVTLFQKKGEQQARPQNHQPDSERLFPVRLLHDQDYTLILGRSSVSHHVPQLAEQWQAAESTIQLLGKTCAQLDRDGVKLYMAAEANDFFSGELLSCEVLQQQLQTHYPPAPLDYVAVLEMALEEYFQRKAAGQSQPNGELFLVMIDGEPSDRQRFVNLIVQSTQRMDNPQELAIGLVQIGEDCIAQGFFQALDDDLYLAGAAYDIVHTQKITTIDTEHLLDFLWDVLTD